MKKLVWPGRRKALVFGSILMVVAVMAVVRVATHRAAAADAAQASPPAIPVIITTAAKQDVPIFAAGIGTVQPAQSVTVKVRVDGQLGKISFAEGQDVKAGDLLPSAGLGALLILIVAGYDLSVIALIGIILLIGIVKKNGIMMVDFALSAEREHGKSPEDSIFEACLLRFRPIMMTTMCAILAGVPLALGHGTGSELRRPLGFAMVGGLLLSQALTLFTTPVVYLYLDRASQWFARRRAATRSAAGGAAQAAAQSD